jgi:hypothetical protein
MSAVAWMSFSPLASAAPLIIKEAACAGDS